MNLTSKIVTAVSDCKDQTAAAAESGVSKTQTMLQVGSVTKSVLISVLVLFSISPGCPGVKL